MNFYLVLSMLAVLKDGKRNMCDQSFLSLGKKSTKRKYVPFKIICIKMICNELSQMSEISSMT